MRSVLVVLDSVGIGALPDAQDEDKGADTLGHVCLRAGPELRNLERLGLGCIRELTGVAAVEEPEASYGRMVERSNGKDSTTGHWELAGVVAPGQFKTFPEGFPKSCIEALERELGRTVLGNVAASGTEIIRELGVEHQRTGRPIVYTSADPVLQIAAHESVVPVEQLYEWCERAYALAVTWGLNRVIARPFTGSSPGFRRTTRRRDFSLPPPDVTVLDRLSEEGIEVVAVGKVNELFAGRGISRSFKTTSNADGIERMLALLQEVDEGLIFANLVDFDMLYGHRRDVEGYARALEEFDARVPALVSALRRGDVMIITADHGNDPSLGGTDHTREYVPLLVLASGAETGSDLGTRETFADVAATIAEYHHVEWAGIGTSFLRPATRGPKR